MKTGRNDPCPCGSGKKYKKCCLAKDQAAERELSTQKALQQQEQERLAAIQREPPAAAFRPTPPPPPPERILTPLEQQQKQLWDEFEATNPEDIPALFMRLLPDEELFNNEFAFEFMSAIRDHNSRESFAEALAALRQERPDLYEADKQYYLDWELGDALVSRDSAALARLSDELIEVAGYALDSFNDSLRKISYSGETALVASMMQRAIPLLGEDQELFDWVPDEFRAKTMSMLLFKHYEQNPALQADDPGLQAELSPFEELDQQGLEHMLTMLSGRQPRQWTLADFAFKRPSKKHSEEQDPAVQQLNDLLLVFLGALWREHGIPLAKADLARNGLYHYVLRRHAGDIQTADDTDMFVFPGKSRSRPKKAGPKDKMQTSNVLCPDRLTLDSFLAGMIGLLSADFYTAAAVLEIVPAWLDFLVEQKLLSAEEAQLARQDLYQIVVDAREVWERSTSNPDILPNIEQAWNKA